MIKVLGTPTLPRAGRARALLVVTLALAWFATAAASAYVVVLKDGTQIITSKPPERKGQRVILSMRNGTEASYRSSDVDFDKTEEMNRGARLGSVQVIEGTVREIETNQEEVEEKPTLAGLASRGLNRRDAPPSVEPLSFDEEPEEGNSAEFVDLMLIDREPLDDAEVTREILEYLEGQGHSHVRVYRGIAADRPLVEVRANTESELFKGIRDVASGLVQIAPRYPERVRAVSLLFVTERKIRGGQFTMTPNQAQRLVSGHIEPQVYFLRFVEF